MYLRTAAAALSLLTGACATPRAPAPTPPAAAWRASPAQTERPLTWSMLTDVDVDSLILMESPV